MNGYSVCIPPRWGCKGGVKQREVLDEKWGRGDKQKQRDNENRSREEEGKQFKNQSVAYRYPLLGILLYGADMLQSQMQLYLCL